MSDSTTDGTGTAGGSQQRTRPVRTYLQRQQQQREREAEARRQQSDEHIRYLAAMSDDDLIGTAVGFPAPHNELEMMRRLKDALAALTAELVTFRESAEAAAARQEVAADQADEAAGKLVRLTWVLVGSTAAVIALTAVLLWYTSRLT